MRYPSGRISRIGLYGPTPLLAFGDQKTYEITIFGQRTRPKLTNPTHSESSWFTGKNLKVLDSIAKIQELTHYDMAFAQESYTEQLWIRDHLENHLQLLLFSPLIDQILPYSFSNDIVNPYLLLRGVSNSSCPRYPSSFIAQKRKSNSPLRWWQVPF